MHTVASARLKKTMAIVAAPTDPLVWLELGKAADGLVLVTRGDEPASASAQLALSVLNAQGVPTVSHVVIGLDEIGSAKRRQEARRAASIMASHMFPDTRVHCIEKPQDWDTALWTIANQKQRVVHFREMRSHVLVESAEFDQEGRLCVSGVVRGPALDVNALVHVPGLGARRIASVLRHPTTRERALAARNTTDAEQDAVMTDGPSNGGAVQATIIQPRADLQHSLQTEVPVDPFAAEQTFPTEEEERAGEQNAARQRALEVFWEDMWIGKTKREKERVEGGFNLERRRWQPGPA